MDRQWSDVSWTRPSEIAIEFAGFLLDRAREQGSRNFGNNVAHHIKVAVEEALEDDLEFSKLLCSIAVWSMINRDDANRVYYLDSEQRVDYHQQRNQDPAEALIDEQESILAGMDRIRNLSKRILSNDNSSS